MQATEQAIALKAEASFHKREMTRHRREAREAMQKLAALCAMHGIEIEKVAAGRQGHAETLHTD